MQSKSSGDKHLWRAVHTDVQFWIPAAVLAIGVGLLVFIHGR
jgi:hypothetical protein